MEKSVLGILMEKIRSISFQKFRVFVFIALTIFLLITATRQCDFNIFFSAAKDILIRENIYTKLYQGWLHYYYSPLFALLLAPFTFLSEYVITLLWLIFNTYLFYRIWEILRVWLEINLLSKFHQRLFFWVSTLVCIQGIRDNLHYHQVTILMVYLVIQGIDFIIKNKHWQGAGLIALGINFKIMPIVFFPYLIYRGYWRSAFWVVIFWIGFLILPALFIGWDYNQFLLNEWWKGINPTKGGNILDFSRAGFAALVTALFHSEERYTQPIFITQLSSEQIAFITNILRAGVMVLTLYFLRTFPFQKAKSKSHRVWEIGYLFLVTPLIFPHQQNYAFFYLYPSIVYLICFFSNEKNKGTPFLRSSKYKLSVLTLVWLMLVAELFIGEFREFYVGIKLMTWGAILYLLIYIFCQPKLRSHE